MQNSKFFKSYPLILTALLLTLCSARAIIGIEYQMQLGNPSGATADTNNHSHYLIQRTVQALDYNDTLGEPNWVSWNLTSADLGSSGRSSFITDTTLPTGFYQVTSDDYKYSGYDRGHMCPSADRTVTVADNNLVFLMSNIIPQSPANNQTVWANFEGYCRTLAQNGNEILITCGPSGFSGSRIPSGKAAIPDYTWKIAVVVPPGAGMATNRITESTRVITIKVPNNQNVSSTWQNYLTSPEQIQNDTGFTFFTGLSSNIAASLRSKVDGQTTLPPGIDLTISCTHAGAFTQGDTNVVYTITVDNLGSTASSGTVNVTNTLPTGLTATAISGTGWTANLATLTCRRSDSLKGGTNFPPIFITVNVASNAPALVTNIVTVSGGSDAILTNNTAFDETVINPFVNNTNSGIPVMLAGFDVSEQTNYGVSPLPPSHSAENVTITGLTRGSGVTTNTGSAAAHAWGGVNWTNTSAAAAISANRFCTFGITANDGYSISYSSISKFDYRRSGTGATNGLVQYQVGSGLFNDITNVVFTSSTSAGGSIGPIDLSGIAALQNVTNTVIFRIVPFNGTGSSGSWYISDVAGNTNADLAVTGFVTPTTQPLTPIELWRQMWFGTTANSGAAADTNIVTSDGMPNLLKYALGLNPLSATNSPIAGDISTDFLRLTVPRNTNATDVSFFIEATANFNSISWATNNVTIDQNTPTLLQGHYGIPIHSAPSAFMRLRVSRP